MYNFDEEINRLNTRSLKWDVKKGELPMWVADMDFALCPEVYEDLKKRLEKKVFGYTSIDDDWYNSYISWWDKYHNFKMNKNNLLFCLGTVATISSCVRKFTCPNENVVVLTPIYNIFFNSIINNGCRVLESKLIYKNNDYQIDYEDLENKLANPLTNLMIFCNPHNPIGKIWSKEELIKIGELCKKHNVIVISDEVHCDLTLNGNEYTPFASVNEVNENISITCLSPSKCFNIAGLQTAAIYVKNEYLYNKVYRAINTDEVAEGNVFAIEGAISCFTKGRKWLEELKNYLSENVDYAKKYIKENIKNISYIDSKATYLLWLDISKITNDSDILNTFLKDKVGLILSSGEIFKGNGKSFLRMNLATNFARVEDGLNRLNKGIKLFLKQDNN